MKPATQHRHKTALTKKGALQPLQDLGIFFLPDHLLSSLVSEAPTATTTPIAITSLEPSETTTQFDDALANTQVEQTPAALTSLHQRPVQKRANPSCRTCGIAELPSVEAQRKHVKSDWHQYNLKHRLLDEQAQPTSQEQFEKILQGLLTSILEGESDAGNHRDQVQTLFKNLEVTVHENELSEEADPRRRQQQRMLEQQLQEARKSPMIWFSSTLYGPTVRLGVYKNAFADRGQGHNPLELLKSIQIPVPPLPPKKKKIKRAARAGLQAKADQMELGVDLDTHNMPLVAIDQDTATLPVSIDSAEGPYLLQGLIQAQPRYWTLILLGGGHFAAMVVDLGGETNKAARQGSHARAIKVVAHKTFHRYTGKCTMNMSKSTLRKQGGTQSSHGGCNSAGALVRMYNERALKLEVQELLEGWSQWIEKSEFVFMHAPGNNRRVLFHENSVISLADREGRVRSIPFVTRRPTLTELKRVYQELATVKVQMALESHAESVCANVEPEQADPLDETRVSLEPSAKSKHSPLLSQKPFRTSQHGASLARTGA
ncbi:hypothetical protein KVV02_001874 [Mortierella alpina]|uniref:VLRF1 domain-containing protein n=1 Tax=Mortierella alpina TaxID=64518 RepID=A0A9P8ACK6_MORAP|nr:hypothetical protein KVV02_001874 [Mortierella alpina]